MTGYIPTMRHAIIIAAAIAAITLSSDLTRADETIAAYSGAGIGSTRPFTVNGPWEAHFNGSAYFMLMSPKGESITAMGGNMDGTPGTFYSPVSGTYYFRVSGTGPWQISVIPISGK